MSTDLFDRLGEPGRMRELAGYDYFDPRLRTELDVLAAVTAARFAAPVSLISVILDSSQFILGAHGISGWVAEAQGVPAEWSLCATTVLTGAPYCLTGRDAGLPAESNPLLAMTSLRSYLGVPLINPQGYVLGAHCVIDAEPRDYTDAEVARLTRHADEAMGILGRYRLE